MFPIVEVPAEASQALEQMGSKAKFWFESEQLGPCLFKAARPGTGEDWSEKVAAEIAALIGMPHAEYELALSGDERGVVTPRLTGESDQLVHGNELLIELDPDYRMRTEYRTPAHTVSAVLRVLREPSLAIELPTDWSSAPPGVADAAGLLTGYLFLDALIGNTDRHHENWAVIESRQEAESRYSLAPTFDHASCLGRNEPLSRVRERLTTNDSNYTVEAYAERAISALYSSADDTAPLAPIHAFREAARHCPDAARAWCMRLPVVGDEVVSGILEEVPEDRMEPERKEFVSRMIAFNADSLCLICEDL